MAELWEIVPAGLETALFRDPDREAEFDVAVAVYGGEPLRRGGKDVVSVWSGSIRWVGDHLGQAISEADHDRVLAAIREHFRRGGQPYELVLPSGEVEDELGERRPGFKSALPLAQHSDGWSVEDLWLSPAHPSADDYPPKIRYADETGEAEIPRSIEVADGIRQRVIDGAGVAWVGAHAEEEVSDGDRRRLLDRVRSVYDRWGEPVRFT